MKVLVLYQPHSEHRIAVEELVREYKQLYPGSMIEVLDVEQEDGTAMAKLYGMMRYPSLMVLRDDGSMVQSWEGESELPRPEDIIYYASSNL
jgi:hypothetical protein